MTRGEAEERAIDESEAEGPPPLPAKAKTPGPLTDRCGMCRELVMVHDRAWEGCSSFWGLVIAANFCGPECEDEALHLYPADVVAEMWSRRSTRE